MYCLYNLFDRWKCQGKTLDIIILQTTNPVEKVENLILLVYCFLFFLNILDESKEIALSLPAVINKVTVS